MICSKCNINKDIEEFTKDKGNKTGYKHYCKSCAAEYHAKWRVNNIEKVLAYGKMYRDCNDEVYNSSIKQWENINKPLRNQLTALRRARRLKATPTWLKQDQKFDLKFIYWYCKYLNDLTGIIHHVDHIIPLKHDLVCGLHVPWNLQVITKDENLSKSNKLINP